MATTFIVYDKDGNEIDRKEKSFDHYKRHSQRGAAEQKFLDSMYRPGAVTAKIVQTYSEIHVWFDFDKAGRSQMNWKKSFGE